MSFSVPRCRRPMWGSARRISSPFSSRMRRNTPCAAGCWGPKLTAVLVILSRCCLVLSAGARRHSIPMLLLLLHLLLLLLLYPPVPRPASAPVTRYSPVKWRIPPAALRPSTSLRISSAGRSCNLQRQLVFGIHDRAGGRAGAGRRRGRCRGGAGKTQGARQRREQEKRSSGT